MFGKHLFRWINSDSSVSQGAVGMLWVLLFMYLKNVLSWATKHCHCILWQVAWRQIMNRSPLCSTWFVCFSSPSIWISFCSSAVSYTTAQQKHIYIVIHPKRQRVCAKKRKKKKKENLPLDLVPYPFSAAAPAPEPKNNHKWVMTHKNTLLDMKCVACEQVPFVFLPADSPAPALWSEMTWTKTL